MKVILIVATDKNWAIGRDGKLLAHIPGDLKYFKEKTLGATCVMGRKTFESLPLGPLPGRTNCVLTRDAKFAAGEPYRDKLVIVNSVNAVMIKSELQNTNGEIFVIGGGDVYREFLPCADICLVTKIEGAFEADTWFPDLDANTDFEIVYESEQYEENGYTYRFTEYRRREK